MDRMRFVLAIVLSALVMVAWPIIMHYVNPSSGRQAAQQPAVSEQLPSPTPQESPTPTAAAPEPGKKPEAAKPGQSGAQTGAQTPAPVQTTNVPQFDITVATSNFKAKFSNRGAVATSWIIESQPMSDGTVRKLTGADGKALELIPQDTLSTLGAPLSLEVPGNIGLTKTLNSVNYKVEGIDSIDYRVEGAGASSTINLKDGETKTLIFTYTSPEALVKKTFTFHGGKFVFNTSVQVIANGANVPVNMLIGPRIGDQSDNETGSYSQPPQLVAYTRTQKLDSVRSDKITPPFGKINSLDPGSKHIEIDKPLAKDSSAVKFVTADGKFTLGYAHVVARSSDQSLTLDSIPSGVGVGAKIAQSVDFKRDGYIWAGGVDHYFAMLAVPDQPVGEVLMSNSDFKTDDPNIPVKQYPAIAIPVPSDGGMQIFVGPKDRQLLAQVSNDLGVDVNGLINYGFLSFLVRPLAPLIEWALNTGSRMFHNFGWSIVVFTILINLLQSPLRLNSTKKMRKAAKYQPRMKELQEKMKTLKENPKKNEKEIEVLQREQMELMKQANPLGGCLPMLLQMPVFWALYEYLTVALDVRQQPWVLWIRDLSTPDPYKILPIVMCVSMIASSWLQPNPTAGDPSQRMQRIMTTWGMPIMLTWLFFFSAPSGLVLYWMVSNLVGVGIQMAINKSVGQDPQLQPEGAAARGKQPGKTQSTKKQKVAEKEVVGGVK